MEKFEHDVYSIISRLKDIDRDYEVYFDRAKNKFFVYRKGVFCLSLGDRLDKTSIDKAYSSHIRNAEEIIDCMIAHNASLEKKERDDVQNKSLKTFNDYLEYADGKGDVDYRGANSTIWW
jgi:hypothetical protein